MAKLKFDSEGRLIDVLDGSVIQNTPEERVRQEFIQTLMTCTIERSIWLMRYLS